jgi:hypothetical protein
MHFVTRASELTGNSVLGLTGTQLVRHLQVTNTRKLHAVWKSYLPCPQSQLDTLTFTPHSSVTGCAACRWTVGSGAGAVLLS